MNREFRPLHRISRRQSQSKSRMQGVQAQHLTAVETMKMRVLVVPVEDGAKAP